jgi:CBS domain containing-hemolysin-like protein
VSSIELLPLLAVFLVLAAFFAAGETALFALPRLRLRRLARHGAGAELFRNVLDAPYRVLVWILLGNTLANVAATAVMALFFHRWLGDRWGLVPLVAVQVLVTSFLLLVLCELTPKTYALAHGERFALRLAPLLRLVGAGLGPVARVLERVAHAATRLLGGPAPAGATVEDLRALIDDGTRRGVLTPDEARLFEGAFRLRQRTAAHVMTPRADLVAAPETATTAELVELFNLSGHSRLPIYEGTLGRVVGVVEAADLISTVLGDEPQQSARARMRPPFFVAPERVVEDLLRDMQRDRVRLVVVARGQEALGIVTVEDILEEIVGEIESEYHADEPAMRLLDDDSAVVRGDVRVRDVNRLFGTALPSAGDESMEALVRSLWPEMPSDGEERAAPGGERLSVESSVGSRVWSVRVRRAAAATPQPEGR